MLNRFLNKARGNSSTKNVLNEYPTMFQDDEIFIYQMGRVGSSSISRGLKDAKRKHNRFHNLNSETLYYLLQVIENYRYDDIALPRKVSRHVARSNWARNRLHYRLAQGSSPIKVICVFRDPLSYLISAFFQNFERYYVKRMHELNYELTVEDISKYINDLLNGIMEHQNSSLSSMFKKYDNPADRLLVMLYWNSIYWFETELDKTFSIDQSDYLEFRNEVYRNKNFELLLLKFGDFANWEGLIKRFINEHSFQLPWFNAGSDKPYGRLYNEVKTTIRLPAHYVHFVLNSSYVQSFFTLEEIGLLRQNYS